MNKLFLLICSTLVLGAASNPATAAKGESAKAAAATCDAKYFGHLVGQGLDSARSIDGVNYRVLPAGANAGEANPKRMTIKVDAKNVITEVGCG